ncbi:hypothetical protein BJX66DRAFT_318028, partial [Aspergillus keveii]
MRGVDACFRPSEALMRVNFDLVDRVLLSFQILCVSCSVYVMMRIVQLLYEFIMGGEDASVDRLAPLPVSGPTDFSSPNLEFVTPWAYQRVLAG